MNWMSNQLSQEGIQVTVLLRKTKKLKMNQNQKPFTNSILMEKTGEIFFSGCRSGLINSPHTRTEYPVFICFAILKQGYALKLHELMNDLF